MSRRPWAVVRAALFVTAGAWMLGGMILGAAGADWNAVRHAFDQRPMSMGAAVAAGIALYLASHALRVVRLAVMIDDDRVGLRATFVAHFFAAGVSLLIPFKLGELYRVVEIDRVLRRVETPPGIEYPDAPGRAGWRPAARALLLVWSERVLDLVTLTGAFVVPLALGAPSPASSWFEFAPALAVAGTVVAGTLVIFFVIPENIESLKLYLIRRYNAPWTLRLLRTLTGIQAAIGHTPAALARRATTLIVLTLLIWSLEVAVLSLFLPAAVDALGAVLTAVAFFFSNLLPGAGHDLRSIVARVRPAAASDPGLTAAAALYPGAIFAALLVVAAGLFAGCLPSRLREARGRTTRRVVGYPRPARIGS